MRYIQDQHSSSNNSDNEEEKESDFEEEDDDGIVGEVKYVDDRRDFESKNLKIDIFLKKKEEIISS